MGQRKGDMKKKSEERGRVIEKARKKARRSWGVEIAEVLKILGLDKDSRGERKEAEPHRSLCTGALKKTRHGKRRGKKSRGGEGEMSLVRGHLRKEKE